VTISKILFYQGLVPILISGWNWYCRTHSSWDVETGN